LPRGRSQCPSRRRSDLGACRVPNDSALQVQAPNITEDALRKARHAVAPPRRRPSARRHGFSGVIASKSIAHDGTGETSPKRNTPDDTDGREDSEEPLAGRGSDAKASEGHSLRDGEPAAGAPVVINQPAGPRPVGGRSRLFIKAKTVTKLDLEGRLLDAKLLSEIPLSDKFAPVRARRPGSTPPVRGRRSFDFELMARVGARATATREECEAWRWKQNCTSHSCEFVVVGAHVGAL